MILRKMMRKILCGNFEKSFLEWEKMALRKVFQHFLHVNFFMFILLTSNHTVFLVQFGINLHLWVFQKAETALAEAARAISAFLKTHLCKLIPNWTRNRMITYTNDPHTWSTYHSNTVHNVCGNINMQIKQEHYVMPTWNLFNGLV